MDTFKFNYLVIVLALSSSIIAGVPCKFNDQCTCVPGFGTPLFFEAATCSFSGDLKPLITKPGPKYGVGSFNIILNGSTTYEVPAQYFAGFEAIRSVNLTSNGGYADQKFDPDAFVGVEIYGLITRRIKGVIPPPEAFKKIGSKLATLDLTIPQTIRLEDNYFIDFPHLLDLVIKCIDNQLHVEKISDNAFTGLENTLNYLSIAKTNFSEFPVTALSKLTNLFQLELEAGNFKHIPSNAFSKLQKLYYISLSNHGTDGQITAGTTNLEEAADPGFFESLPRSVGALSLRYNFLSSVPKLTRINNLNLEGNSISTLNKGDFDGSNTLMRLNVNYNPLTKIDPDALPLAPQASQSAYYSFSKINLESLDLSVFNLSPDSTFTYLNAEFIGNQLLKSLTVSDINKFPVNAGLDVIIEASGLQTIDPAIGTLLSTRQRTRLNIRNNNNLICKDLDWMAYYVFCSLRLNIDNARCADQGNQLLIDYLKTKEPAQCGGQ